MSPLPFPPAAPGAGFGLSGIVWCVRGRRGMDCVDASGFGYVDPVHYHQLYMVCSKTQRRVFVSFYCDFQFRTEDYLLTRDRWLQREGVAASQQSRANFCSGLL